MARLTPANVKLKSVDRLGNVFFLFSINYDFSFCSKVENFYMRDLWANVSHVSDIVLLVTFECSFSPIFVNERTCNCGF